MSNFFIEGEVVYPLCTAALNPFPSYIHFQFLPLTTHTTIFPGIAFSISVSRLYDIIRELSYTNTLKTVTSDRNANPTIYTYKNKSKYFQQLQTERTTKQTDTVKNPIAEEKTATAAVRTNTFAATKVLKYCINFRRQTKGTTKKTRK